MSIGPTIENLRKKRAEEAALLERLYALPTPTGGFDVNTPAERRQLVEYGLRGGEPYSDGGMDYGRQRPVQETIDVMPQQPAEYYAREVSRDLFGERATNDLFGYPQGTGNLVGDILTGGGMLGAIGATAPLTAWDAGAAAARGDYGDAALKSAFSLLEGAGLNELATGARGLRTVANEFPEAAQEVGQRVRGFLADESGSLPLPFSTAGQATGKLDELTGLPLNADGTVTLYHGTTKQNAQAITKDSRLRSAGEPDVYLTTDKTGGGYGDGTVVAVDVDPKTIKLDDAFPNGRLDFRLPVGRKLVSSPLKVTLIPFRADDPAQARGAQIIDMLTSGRAGEITDEMLDLGDPVANARLSEYLFKNYDLPMDEASRMERAQRMGLTEDTIHGTLSKNDFTGFKGADSYGSLLGRENYVAPNTVDGQKLAAQFSTGDQGRVLPLRTPKPLDTSTLEGRLRFEQIMDDKNRLDDFRMKGGYKPSGLPSWADQWAIDTANEAGEKAIRLHERDWVDSTAIFNPTDIRSRFARFDPRLAHLRNLSAGVAGGVPLGLMSMPTDEEQYR